MSSSHSQRPLLDFQRTASMNGANREANILKPCFKRVEGLGAASIVTLVAVAIGAIPKYSEFKLHQDTLTIAVLVSITSLFTSGLFLTNYAMCMSHRTRLTVCQYMFHTLIVSYHGFNLILTGLLLVALLEYGILLLACFLVPMLLFNGIIGYAGTTMDQNDGETSNEAFENAIKSCSDVSIVTSGAALSALIAIVIARLANPLPSSTSPYPPLDLSATVVTFTAGVFSTMVMALPMVLMPPVIRSKLVVVIKHIKSTMVILTLITVMILSAKFLDGVVFLALLPELLVEILYQAVILLGKSTHSSEENNLGENTDSSEENNFNDEPENPTFFSDVGKACVVLLSVIYALYSGRETYDIYLRVSVFILTSVTVVNLNRMIIPLKPPARGEQWVVNVAKFITFIFPGLQMLTACAVALKIVVDIYQTL